MEEGIFLCWDPKTIQGAYVAVVRPNGNMSIVVASAPNPWPHEDVKETWKIEEEPNGKQRIWISNKGRI
eukprot:13016697-Alexandrium_andersonii.AAC.1